MKVVLLLPLLPFFSNLLRYLLLRQLLLQPQQPRRQPQALPRLLILKTIIILISI